jgi:hypothetical protein
MNLFILATNVKPARLMQKVIGHFGLLSILLCQVELIHCKSNTEMDQQKKD